MLNLIAIGRKEVLFLTFNVIFWHKLYYLIDFFIDTNFIIWMIFSSFENMCSVRSQLFCLQLQRMAVLFDFSTIISHTNRQKLSKQGHKNRHFKHVYSLHARMNFVFCEMFFKIIVLKQHIKNSTSKQSKKQNSLTLSSIYHPPIILQNMFFHIYSD